MSSGYDPIRAAESVRRLAAVTDDELARGVREASAEVLARVDEQPAGPMALGALAAAAAEQTRGALAALPADAAVRDVVAAVAPVLNVWWPDHPAGLRLVHEAVEALRTAAMHLPRLVDDARRSEARD
jgi:hypothetical protein